MPRLFNVPKREGGYTLIELVIFMIVLGILAESILLAYHVVLSSQDNTDFDLIAAGVAQSCMEYQIGKNQGGESFKKNCGPISVPEGMTVTVSQTPWDNRSEQMQVTLSVSGKGYAKLSALLDNR